MCDHECPTCGDEFETDQGVKVHHYQAHGESIAADIEKVCPECDEAFYVTQQRKNQTFCSLACKNESQRDRVQLECEGCGDTFDIAPNKADSRRYCSSDCLPEPEQITITCETCGDEFTVPHWKQDRRFCSHECAHIGDREYDDRRRTCPGCGIWFDIDPDHPEQQYCTMACAHEANRDDEHRPDTLDQLLVDLYDGLDLNLKQTWKRAKTAVRDGSYDRDDITKKETRERLKELGAWTHHKSFHNLAQEIDADDLGMDEDDESGDVDDSWRDYYSTRQEGSADD